MYESICSQNPLQTVLRCQWRLVPLCEVLRVLKPIRHPRTLGLQRYAVGRERVQDLTRRAHRDL